MKKTMLKIGALSIAVAVLAAGLVPVMNSQLFARPNYMKEFTGKYPNVTEAATAKCNVCHFGDSKKNRNEYGKAFGGGLPGANTKEAPAVVSALTKAEAGKRSKDGKTFGEVLKAGQLPSSAD